MLTLLIALLYAVSLLAETTVKSINTSPGKTLTVNLQVGGSITVSGWDKNEVRAEISYDGDQVSPDFFAVEEAPDGVEIELNRMEFNLGATDIHLNIHVPKQYNLDLETMGGSIRISDVEGNFEGKTMGGSLDLSGLKGEIDMTTMGGSISLTKSYGIDGSLKTMGGDVRFNDVMGNVKGSTMGGDITYRNVSNREGEPMGDEVKISTMGGSIEVNEAPQGADVHTMGGDIEIKKADIYVKAKTMGGDIDINSVNGWVKASTMGGDVTVVMVGDGQKGKRDVNISSMGGEIELTLPSNISAKFDVHLTYTKDSRQDFKINSDFDMDIEEKTKEWQYRQGTPRKEIVGKGQVGGGKNTIHIDTINGNIRIKKGN